MKLAFLLISLPGAGTLVRAEWPTLTEPRHIYYKTPTWN